MTQAKNIIHRAALCMAIVPLLLVWTPFTLTARAESSPTQGPAQPTGADSATYRYNETTGKWENDHFVWDPVTKQTSPKESQSYSYNPATGMWDTTDWRYDAPSGHYQPNTVSTDTPPAPASLASQADGTTGAPETTPSSAQPSVDQSKSTNGTFDNFYNASISNKFQSSAVSGDAAVSGNTTGGDAGSGNASSTTTLINMLQSSAPIGDLGKIATFNANIDGSVVGDLLIDPAMLSALQPASSTTNLANSIKVNNATNTAITNNLTVGAQSGTANVSNNTTGGDATSGNANAVANLINLLNTSIAAGQSFIGQLNINGDFNGDVLMPPGALSALLASGTTPSSNLTVTNNQNNSLQANLSDNQTTTNTVTANAKSGNANVANNTTAGNASSGNASTNVTLLNLTGHDVTGSNSLLVFVNVLGKWIGAIVDAPAGSTSAALGGNVTDRTTVNNDISLTSANNTTINNNVNVGAQSGDASVDHNTHGGNARSGNATASANIANISNSNLSLSDWFGVLFINVFGTWNGSFGIDTDAGSVPTPPATASSAGNPRASTASSTPGNRMAPGPQRPVFGFASPGPVIAAAEPIDDIDTELQDQMLDSAADTTQQDRHNPVLGLATTNHSKPPTLMSPTSRDFSMAVSAVVIGAVLVGIERLLAARDQRRVQKESMTMRELVGRSR